MIKVASLLEEARVAVKVFECDGHERRWSEDEPVTDFMLMLVQSGSFRRRVQGIDALVDPLVAYIELPGTCHQVCHPSGGDVCTGLWLSDVAMGSLVDPSRVRPGSLLYIESAAYLAHRLLLKGLRETADREQSLERCLLLAGILLVGREEQQFKSDEWLHIADHVREALRADPELSLMEIARLMGTSMYRISKVFRSVTGETFSRYRLKLRCQLALDRLTAGETSLARLAADTGFSDQAHMTRTLRQQLNATPRRLRELVAIAVRKRPD
ncbi:MAG TPA: helix-turn-helix transcriptional regulator [Candidatus Dormibacteraeota bacterium]|nr:helix-turn-helix transcriptional regulator [Candidatus Dormibacteraeota bacterium]